MSTDSNISQQGQNFNFCNSVCWSHNISLPIRYPTIRAKIAAKMGDIWETLNSWLIFMPATGDLLATSFTSLCLGPSSCKEASKSRSEEYNYLPCSILINITYILSDLNLTNTIPWGWQYPSLVSNFQLLMFLIVLQSEKQEIIKKRIRTIYLKTVYKKR